MSKVFMFAVALLCCTAWLQAQNQYPQNPPSSTQPGSSPTEQNPPSASSPSGSASNQTGTSSSQTSIEGCLQGSNGNFTLTDNSGTTYQLQGDASKLSKHVGQEVQITGSAAGSGAAGSAPTSGSSPASSATGTSQASSQPTFTVEKLKHKSDTCTNKSK